MSTGPLGEQVPLDGTGGYLIVGPWGCAEQPPLPLEDAHEGEDGGKDR